MLQLLKRHPVAGYAALTLLWSYGCWAGILLLVPPGGLGAGAPPLAFALAALGGIGPSLAGLALTRLVDRPDGFRRLGARLRRWRLGRWWLALLIPYALNGALLLGYALAGGPVRVSLAGLPAALGLGLFAMLSEEFGWRGFALPHLRAAHSPRRSALILGGLWGLWHSFGNYTALGGHGWLSVALVIVTAPALLTAFAVALSWLYERTNGSMLMSLLFHASISSSGLLLDIPATSTQDQLRWALGRAALWWLLALALLPRLRASMSQPSGTARS